MDEKEKKVDDKGKKVNEKEKNVDEKYLAHIAEDGREQSNSEHLENTASLAADFARPFRGEEWARLCGLGHDNGEYSAEFQKRIRGAKMKVDPAMKGSQILVGQGALPAAFCVAGHHG